MKKIIIISLLIFLIGCDKQQVIDNNTINENEIKKSENIKLPINEDPINIYLFWGNGCSACSNIKEYFNNLDSNYNKYFNLIKYEIWNNEDNSKLMYEIGDLLNQNYYAVPFLVIGDEVIIGFSKEKEEYILDKIMEEYNNDKIDIMEELNKRKSSYD